MLRAAVRRGPENFSEGPPSPQQSVRVCCPLRPPHNTDGSNRVVATFTKFLSLRDKTAMALNYIGHGATHARRARTRTQPCLEYGKKNARLYDEITYL